jgi:hypothetical protein
LNQRYDDGLRLARASQPQRAFKLHCFRGEYDEALTLIGWRGEGELDAAWIDSLPLDARTPDSLQSRNRFTFALEVAEVLRKLGRAADVERLLAAVEAYIAAVPERRGTSVADAPPLRNHYVQRYCGALYRGGMTDRAWDVFGPNNTSSLDPYLHPPSWFVTEAFGTRGAEVQVWWRHFSQSRDGRSPRDLAAQVAAVLVPKSQADVECFPALAANAIAKLQAENMTFDSHWRALGDTCRAYGQQELALRCYDRANELSGPSDDAAARALYRAQRWPEAAQRYEQVWRSNRDAIGAWYLSGEALFRAGEEDAGTLRKRQALLMAAAPRVRWQLGVYLQEHGLSETPVKRWEELLRLAPLESWETIDAAWRLSADGLDHDPARAADLWEQHTLYDFRVDSAFRNVEAYLRTPFIIHRQRASAALAAQDWEGLSREADLAMRAVPSDTTLAEELVPALIAQGRTAEADTVFDRAWQAAAKLVAAYPNSAEFKNHQAWLAARCDKRLDEALALAEKSVALDPNKSYNLDTLAEVHFRLGHREDAVKFGTLALDFRPLSESLRQQLKRFQEAPDRN